MKNWSLRLMILLTAFFIGVSFVAFWFFNRSDSAVEIAPVMRECYPQYSGNFNVADYKGVLTGRVYRVDENKSTKPLLDEDINTEVTANLFSLFREMPLTKLPACVDESYRLTWIPTFHAPTVVRVWRSGDKYFIAVKRLSGKGGYGLGELDIEQAHSITFQEWQSIETLIYQSAYWKMPSTIKESIPNDGATWTFEGLNGGQHHSVFRITPSGELAQIFKKLFELTDVKTEYKLYLS